MQQELLQDAQSAPGQLDGASISQIVVYRRSKHGWMTKPSELAAAERISKKKE